MRNATCSKPWFIYNGTQCVCSHSAGSIITCEGDSVTIKACFCMTVNDDNKTTAGSCPYTCENQQTWYPDPTDLNHHLCTETWNRSGKLCSRCMDGYGPPIYSYNLQCAKCHTHDVNKSIVRFLASFIPLTAFCLVIIAFRISGAKPPMSTFILVSQVMSAPQYILLTLEPIRSYRSSIVPGKIHSLCWQLFVTFFGLWNLDIGRALYPPICLSQNMSALQVMSLEYITASFPLAILFAVAIGVKLYDRGYRIIFCVCRPVHSCFAHLRRTIDIKTSLIDAFATFIILSQNKIGYTSFRIFQMMYVYRPEHNNHSLSVYIDPNIEYLGNRHLLYAIPALILSIVFILIPLLLLFLYPLRAFQAFLNSCQWQCSALHIFADTFQGCYKNGTDGTRDYRWFAGLHFLMRFAIVALYDFNRYRRVTSFLSTLSVSFYIVVLAVCQPYKKPVHLKQDMVLLFGLLLWNSAVLVTLLDVENATLHYFLHLVILLLGSLIPFLYIAGIIINWLLVVKKLHMWIFIKLKKAFHSEDQLSLLT